jgi:hypothetical protein
MHKLMPARFCTHSRGGTGKPKAVGAVEGTGTAGRRDFTLTGIV